MRPQREAEKPAMTEPPRRTLVGVFPTSGVIFVDGPVDPAAGMLADAGAALDRQRADEERVQRQAAADAARLQRTKKARAARRLRKVLRLCLR
jgi:hypothetical protein